jgi:hypothetical protein
MDQCSTRWFYSDPKTNPSTANTNIRETLDAAAAEVVHSGIDAWSGDENNSLGDDDCTQNGDAYGMDGCGHNGGRNVGTDPEKGTVGTVLVGGDRLEGNKSVGDGCGRDGWEAVEPNGPEGDSGLEGEENVGDGRGRDADEEPDGPESDGPEKPDGPDGREGEGRAPALALVVLPLVVARRRRRSSEPTRPVAVSLLLASAVPNTEPAAAMKSKRHGMEFLFISFTV